MQICLYSAKLSFRRLVDGRQFNQLVAVFGQIGERYASALPDELGHRLHLGARNVNEFAAVVDDARQRPVGHQLLQTINGVLSFQLERRCQFL